MVQFVDPAVSRVKFERELDEYREHESDYRQRGWFITDVVFPRILVVLAAPQLKPPALVMGVSFDYTNYDAMPPSVSIVNPFTGMPFALKELPSPLNRGLANQELQLPGLPQEARMVIQQAQPLMQGYGPDDIPFLCLAGVREYHQHPAHSGDAWELHRLSGAGRFVRLLEIIHRYGVAPITGYGVNLVPQIGFAFGPPPP